jgi:hypothetical protein
LSLCICGVSLSLPSITVNYAPYILTKVTSTFASVEVKTIIKVKHSSNALLQGMDVVTAWFFAIANNS